MVTVRCGELVFHNIQAVIFDKDGTLSYSEEFLRQLGKTRSRLLAEQIPGIEDSLLQAFGLEGDRLNPAGLLAVASRLENEIATAAYIAQTGRGWIDALAIAKAVFDQANQHLERKAHCTPLLPGGLQCLQNLAKAGLKIGVLTSDSTENLQDFVCYYQLQPYLHLQMGFHPQLSKPDPRLLERACLDLGVTPGVTLMVGDSRADLKMARSAGAAGSIGVTWGWTIKPELPDADVVLDAFEQIQVIGGLDEEESLPLPLHHAL